MSDSEWNEWQSRWADGGGGPLPDVRARARREARLHRRANVAFFALVAVGLAGAGYAFLQPGDAYLAGLTIVAFLAAMSIGYLLIQRGAGPRATDDPRGALAFLERRLRIERRVAHLVRWVYAALCVVFVVVFPQLIDEQEDAHVQLAIGCALLPLLLVGTFAAPSWVARKSRPHHEEIERWRRWLDEQQL